ncbi:MAG: hypothetical protein WAQ99_22830 [Pyrinomonadaceae bacterium]
MRKTTIALLTLLVSSAVTFAQEHKERSAPTPRPPQTQTPPQSSETQSSSFRYTSPEGRYSILLPGQSKLSSQQVNSPDGLPMTQYMVTAAGTMGMVMVAYFDYAADVVFSLDKARDGMVNSIKGTLLDEHSMSLGGAPGRQVKISARTEQGIDFIDRARFYDVKPRVYVLQCISPKSIDSAAIAERCDQFFDSFRVRSTP